MCSIFNRHLFNCGCRSGKWFFLSFSRCSIASDVFVAAVLLNSSTTTIGTTLQSHTRLNSRKQYLNDRTHVHNNDDIFVLLVFQTIVVSTPNEKQK